MHYQSDDQDGDSSSNLNTVLSQMLAAQMGGSSDLGSLARLGFPQLQQARSIIEASRQKPSFSGKLSYFWFYILTISTRPRSNNNRRAIVSRRSTWRKWLWTWIRFGCKSFNENIRYHSFLTGHSFEFHPFHIRTFVLRTVPGRSKTKPNGIQNSYTERLDF